MREAAHAAWDAADAAEASVYRLHSWYFPNEREEPSRRGDGVDEREGRAQDEGRVA